MIIDELGFVPLSRTGAESPFDVFSASSSPSECSSQGCYAPTAADQGKYLKVVTTYYDGASGPRNSQGNLIISSSYPTRYRRTVEETSANAVAMGGL